MDTKCYWLSYLKRIRLFWWWYGECSNRLCVLYIFVCISDYVLSYVALYQRWGVLFRSDVRVGPVYTQCHQRNWGNHLSGSEWLQDGPLLCLSARWAERWHPQNLSLPVWFATTLACVMRGDRVPLPLQKKIPFHQNDVVFELGP